MASGWMSALCFDSVRSALQEPVKFVAGVPWACMCFNNSLLSWSPPTQHTSAFRPTSAERPPLQPDYQPLLCTPAQSC